MAPTEEFRSAAMRWPMPRARLVLVVGSGRCPQRLARAMSIRIFAIAHRFVHDLSRLAGISEDPLVKLYLLENLLEESGVHRGAGGELRIDKDRIHLNWARTFARACGLGDEELEGEAARLAWGQDSWVEAAIAQGDWLGATAFIVAQEANAPRTLKPMMHGLLAAGHRPEDLVFFRNHLDDDERHGNEGLSALGAAAATSEARARVLAGIEQGAREWWQVHN